MLRFLKTLYLYMFPNPFTLARPFLLLQLILFLQLIFDLQLIPILKLLLRLELIAVAIKILRRGDGRITKWQQHGCCDHDG